MSRRDLAVVYREYLQCLNERRWDDLGLFVADAVRYNEAPLGLSGYRAMLEADTTAIPDLEFAPDIVIADDRIVSCRLMFRCTPAGMFLGLEATGASVSFAEHVFYRFEDVRIVEVWSLIDKDAVRKQMSSPTRS